MNAIEAGDCHHAGLGNQHEQCPDGGLPWFETILDHPNGDKPGQHDMYREHGQVDGHRLQPVGTLDGNHEGRLKGL